MSHGSPCRAGRSEVSTKVSDQDFFFDEDDSGSAGKRAAKGSGGAKASAVAPAQAATPTAAGSSVFDQNITMAVAALLMIIALLIGVILGFFLGQSTAAPAVVSTIPAATGTDTGAGASPAPLSPEQMNQGLPAGHVPIDQGAATGTPTP
jgi:hypothetical protein